MGAVLKKAMAKLNMLVYTILFLKGATTMLMHKIEYVDKNGKYITEFIQTLRQQTRQQAKHVKTDAKAVTFYAVVLSLT